MDEHELNFMLSLGDTKEPPTEFRIFHAGVNKTLKGDVVVNEAALDSVFAMEKTRGRTEIPFDYGHAAVQGPQNESTILASGWGRLARREGDFWVEGIKWTPKAHGHISNREIRFTSPAVMIDTKTGELRSLTNIALTNLPATVGQKPLVASNVPPAAPAVNGKKPSMEEKEMLALMLALDVTDPAAIPGAVAARKLEREQLLTAQAETQKKLAESVATLKKLADDTETADHAAIMKQLGEDMKLTPAMETWAKGQTAASLKLFGESATAVLGSDKKDKSKVKGAQAAEGKPAAPHDADTVKVYTAMGLTAQEFDTERTHLLAEPSFWESDPSRGPAAPQQENK